MWEKAYIVRMWDELDQLWTNFRDQKLDQNFKQVSSCARSLDPGPLSRLRNEGFSANTCFSRPPHAPGHIEMILAFQTFRAEPEKNLSFPPVLHGFSHCGTHRDFDLACFRPGCVVSAAARTVYCATVRPIFHPAVPASAPRLTSGLGLPGFAFRGGVPAPVGHGGITVYSVARTVGDPVCRTPRIRTTFDADSRWSFPPLSQPWHYVRSCPEEPLCWRPSRRDEALSSLYFGFR